MNGSGFHFSWQVLSAIRLATVFFSHFAPHPPFRLRYFPLLLVSVLVLVAAAAYDILVVQLFWRELGLAMPSTIMSMLRLGARLRVAGLG